MLATGLVMTFYMYDLIKESREGVAAIVRSQDSCCEEEGAYTEPLRTGQMKVGKVRE